jgi:WD40 repeat protein
MCLRHCLFFTTTLVLLAPGKTIAEPPLGADKASSNPLSPRHADLYGDPLPPGVVARLGTERLIANERTYLAFSPDGKRVAAFNGYEDLRVWEVSSGSEILHLKTPRLTRAVNNGLVPLVFSRNGKVLALSCQDNTVRVVRAWEVATGKQQCDFTIQADRLAFLPDGKSIVAASNAGPILSLDLSDKTAPRPLCDFPERVRFMAVSRDGKTLTAVLITGDGKDAALRTFVCLDLSVGRELSRCPVRLEAWWNCNLAPEGDAFAGSTRDGKNIVVIDPRTCRERWRAQVANGSAIISFSADGSALAAAGRDGMICVWDSRTGQVRARFKVSSLRPNCIAMSPDGNTLALTGRADQAVHLWDVRTRRELHAFAGHRAGRLTVAFVGSGQEIATTSRDRHNFEPTQDWADWSMRRWDASTGAQRAVTTANPKGEVHLTAFSADGRRLVVVVHDGTMHLWDVEAGTELRSWQGPSWLNPRPRPGKDIKEMLRDMTWVAFSADGKTLLAGSGPKVQRWDVATGKQLPAFNVQGVTESRWCAVSPDGRSMAVNTQTPGRAFALVDTATGVVQRRMEARRDLYQATFSPDGRTLAVSDGTTVSLWEAGSGRPRGQLTSASKPHFSLAFAPGGRILAIGSQGNAPLALWDVATGKIIGELGGDFCRVESLAFSHNGNRLALAGDSASVLVADVAAVCGKTTLTEVFRRADCSAEELEALWAVLTGANGMRAYRAIQRLGSAGPRSVAFLKDRLKKVPSPDERRIPRLIADLDHEDIARRDRASQELESLGQRAAPALKRVLEAEPTAEVRRRASTLLERLDMGEEAPAAELVRLRVVEALEANGTSEARKVLAEIASTEVESPLGREARASLERLAQP